jgi:hypothetical protein
MKETSRSLFPYFTEVDLASRSPRRKYHFPGGDVVTIESPKTLIVSENGHRIITKDGQSHYIPYGWIHLEWENMPDRATGFLCQEDKEKDKKE